MYPKITNIKDILPFVEHKANIIIKDNGNGTTSINYTTITDNKLFNCEYARECRGITFDNATGAIVIRPFQKFFNIGEKEETLPENLDWNKVTSVSEKIDGSICTTMVLDGKVVAKSMSSFDSIHAKYMTKYINKYSGIVALCKRCFECGYTPIFEYISPKFQIVIPYDKEELVLLAIRYNETGVYMSQPEMYGICANHGINGDEFINNMVVSKYGTDWDSMQEALSYKKNTEGYVIQFNNGQIVKAKTLWYVQLHRCKAQLSEKNVAEACLTGVVDDIKGMMTTMGLDTTRVNEIDIMVSRGFKGLQDQTEKLFTLYDFEYDPHRRRGKKSRKNFALDWRQEKCFSLVMRKIDGKEIDYVSYYRKRILPNKFDSTSVIV